MNPAAFHPAARAMRILGVVFAVLASGQAMGQEVASRESASVHGAATMPQPQPQPRLRLYADAPSTPRHGWQSMAPGPAARVGVEFKLAPNPALVAAHGTLLRTNLSQGTNLSLRVRRHGLGVVLRSEF